MEIPVYLFLGFLESGKTKFIQETLQDRRFNSGEKTLLLLCEEGIEEYDEKKFSGKNVYIKVIDDISDFNSENLNALRRETRAERVIIEYNGMWTINDLMENLPDNFVIYQTMAFADATNIINYNENMRSLVADKASLTDVFVFNRYNDSIDKLQLHQIVRSAGSRCDIIYEYDTGKVEYDDIEDPLPFDVDAPVIEIKDNDYAYFYRDLMENMENYNGKTVQFKGIAATDKKSVAIGAFVIGRHVMTCCEADITYAGLVCEWENADKIKTRDWLNITAKISVEHNKLYSGKGPVLKAQSVSPADVPDPQLVTF